METNLNLMKSVFSNDIHGIIDSLGLQDFKQPSICLVNQDKPDNIEKAELSKEDDKDKSYLEVQRRAHQDKVLNWLAEKKPQVNQAELKKFEAATRSISFVKNKRFPEPALMSLGHDENGKILTLIDEQYEFRLSPWQVISLLESPNEKIELDSEEDYYYAEDGKAIRSEGWNRTIGTIHPRRGQLTIYHTNYGEPITDPYGDICYRIFNIEIERLVMFYAIFKREEAERARLLQLRHE
jgi:hypothetical protein